MGAAVFVIVMHWFTYVRKCHAQRMHFSCLRIEWC